MATRLYLCSQEFDGTGHQNLPVTPAFHTSWQETGTNLRRRMRDVLNEEPQFTDATATTTPGNTTMHRQLISDPLVAGITFTSGVSTFTAQILGRESAANDNIINRVRVLRVFNRGGDTVQATLIAFGNATSVTEWLNSGLRNLTFLNATAVGATYTTVQGDRLVFELGHDDSGGTSITGSLRFGATASATGDCGVNETDTTTTLRGWLESSVDLIFEGFPPPPRVMPFSVNRAFSY